MANKENAADKLARMHNELSTSDSFVATYNDLRRQELIYAVVETNESGEWCEHRHLTALGFTDTEIKDARDEEDLELDMEGHYCADLRGFLRQSPEERARDGAERLIASDNACRGIPDRFNSKGLQAR
jgi:hypothetical protein